MVINRGDMKRKRREESRSPLLDDSPKRTKVHAQRKFAQGSNVNSPVITPVKELEKQEIDVLPEPVELLPIKRPNTEDFLTFLCFRGTPILPQSLNFFNTASIVDTNGQVHEIKSESPKNGPIDTSAITKTGSGSSERPFVAFGVRKRADPIVISRQMDKKRRHALALQALRRKYQEQRMAKIRAVAINKLSEKTTSKTLVRSNSVSKTESQAVKKTNSTVQKTKTPEPVKPPEKMATRSVKAASKLPQIKQKMCLRSFRGRFVQKELQFRNVKKRPLSVKQENKIQHITADVNSSDTSSEYSSDDEQPLSKAAAEPKLIKVDVPKIAKKSAPGPKKPAEINFRITRSNKFITGKIGSRRQQIKQRMLLNTPGNTVKPRTLRSHTNQKSKQNLLIMKQKKGSEKGPIKKETPKVVKPTGQVSAAKKEVKVTMKNKEAAIDNQKKELKREEAKVINKTPEAATKKDKSPIPSVSKSTKMDTTKKTKIASKPPPKKEILKKKVVVPKTSPKVVDSAVKKDPVKKKEATKPAEGEAEKKATVVKSEPKENMEQRISQRPTRKTKEAAAIYMEILSHKLVNDSKVDDDDNVSIDSFPELPNVKRTEQRENELKAKAKCTKACNADLKTRAKETIEDKSPKIGDKKKVAVKKNAEEQVKCEECNPSEVKTEKGEFKPEKCDDKEGVAEDVAVPSTLKESDVKVQLSSAEKGKSTNKESLPKRKCRTKYSSSDSFEFASDEEFRTKSETKPKSADAESGKRQTRNSSQNNRHVESDDSDESFRVEIRIPRKKQITRSRVSKCCDSELEKSPKSVHRQLRTAATSYKDYNSSESDRSTTSDVNVTPREANKNKKFTKVRCLQKEEQNFSDSDEEPLSKLTQNKTTTTNKEGSVKEEFSEKKVKGDSETRSRHSKDKQTSDYAEKPKRECAKRPQNYLPMFSSSDEEENFFQGFKLKEPKSSKTKIVETTYLHGPPSLDLSCKDIGRRFGKGKVNMSNEQIEKWLKDSAMAGNTLKTENEAMLKFGEKIPTETSHSVATSIDTEQLKTLLICGGVEKQDSDVEKKEISPKIPIVVTRKHIAAIIKPAVVDRKLIFRNKVKCGASPNINAFSVSNESSVYAFGEEDDVMKAPFRRPNRRPSSTATSRSEDESSKCDELSRGSQFRKPPQLRQDSVKSTKEVDDAVEENIESESGSFYMPSPQPQKVGSGSRKSVISFIQKKAAMVPPPPPRNSEKFEASDELMKYKVPSSPSASSSSSAKLSKRQCSKAKLRSAEILPVNLPEFPIGGASGQLIEAPTFHPSEKEFQDPLEYIEKIRLKAEQFGICRIVPPSTFKPECKVTDDMRFTAYNQYVHKMLHRWGPNFKELMAIKKYLSTQNITLTHPPWIGGMEIDLPRLYQTVQSLGGLKEVIEKKKWPKVSDAMKIPKSAQDRVTKLDDIYCKYLLPYDTLSPVEREKLFDDVETEWAKRESKTLLKAQQNLDDSEATETESESDDEAEECIVKGRSMALNAFYRIARNTMSMWFKTPEPLPDEVEQEFWKHVTVKENHICVHSGSIDSGNWGYGFAVSKNSPFARHAWNLKVLTNNSGSVLRSIGPVMGVTVPTLHVGMVFSSCCWYRDPHSLPWIEYLHTGGSKIWYGIPDSASGSFHAALKSLVPNYCLNKSLWLPSDTVMVPPNLLVDRGVSLCRIVQEPGQFIVVFPKAFTSSLSTGYVVSESVYFAPPSWLKTGKTFFDELRNSCEPSMFSFDRLLLSIMNDARTNVEVLKQIIPAVQELCDKERSARERIKTLGVTATEKLPLPEARKVRKKKQNDDGEYECEVCRMNLFVSMVTESQDDAVYCLHHAAEQLEKKKIQGKHCKLTFTYDDLELDGLVEKIQFTITNKLQKKLPNKYAGMPTLLTK